MAKFAVKRHERQPMVEAGLRDEYVRHLCLVSALDQCGSEKSGAAPITISDIKNR